MTPPWIIPGSRGLTLGLKVNIALFSEEHLALL